MWLTLFGSLFVLLFSGAWIGVAIGITGLIIMHFYGPGIGILGGIVWEAINIYSLLALPGFIFMGQIIMESGLSSRIYEAVSPLTARLPGKLLHSNVILTGMFAAVLGVSSANAAVVGTVAIPELRRRKYAERLLLGTICAGGTLGLLIPPSAALILYGSMADTSIAALFAGATIPGILILLLFMIYIIIRGKITPTIAPAEEKGLPFKATLLSLCRIWPLLILMFACIGPIYLGWATAAESSGIGALAAIIIGGVFGKINWQAIKASLMNTTQTTTMIFFLFLGAKILAVSISLLGIPRDIVLMVGELPLGPISILMLIYLMYIIMGCFLDGISMQLMTIPFIVPIILSLGFESVWFGVVMVLVIEIGLVTPPVGLNLFVVQGIGGRDTSILDIFMGSLPFLVIVLLVMVALTFLPGLVTLFPRFLGL